MAKPAFTLFRFLPASATPRLVEAVLTFAANLFFARLMNVSSPRGPLFVTWSLTYDCNAFCGFCATHKLHKAHPETLGLERALALADEIADAGSWVVGFTGGEVLLSPLLMPLVRRLKERGVVAYLVTNGMLLAEKAADIVDSGIDYVVVSLDSDDAVQHDEQRHSPGLMARALAGMAALKSLRRGQRPLIKAQAILSARNLTRIADILDFMSLHADTVSAQPVVWGYKEHPHAVEKDRLQGMLFQPDEQAQVEHLLKEASSRHPMLGKSYFRRIPAYWFTPERLVEKIACWSPFLRLTINPEGQAFHCGTRFGPVGDLKADRLMEVWNGEEMRRQREVVRQRRNQCICWSQDASFNDFMDRLWLSNRLPVWRKRDPQDP